MMNKVACCAGWGVVAGFNALIVAVLAAPVLISIAG